MGLPREVTVDRRQDARQPRAVRDRGCGEAGNASDVNEGQTVASVLW